MADNTKQKQQYLRSEIIEGGYDPGQFVEFLASQRENGEDIEVWSVSSLEDMVTKFKKDNPLHNDEGDTEESPMTPEKPVETLAQLSAKAQSQRQSINVKDESDEEDEVKMNPCKPFNQENRQGSSAKEESKFEEELIRKSVLDERDAEKALKSLGMMSETEKIKKELQEKAFREKKSALV